jgi:stage II sporulation SpoAA-like protein
MIEQLPGPANNIIRVRVSGKLRDEDFTKLFPLINAAVAGRGKCRLLIELHDFHGWDLHGLWDDLKFHTTPGSGIERIAYVGDKAWRRWVVSLARAFPGAVIRYFDVSETDAVRAWLEER